MFKKCIMKRENIKSLILIGILFMAFGIIPTFIVDKEVHNIYMAAGMLTGIGMALFVLAIFNYIRYKRLSKLELEELEIEMNDERNARIEQMAYSLTFKISMILIGLVVFILMLLNYIVPAYIVLGVFIIASIIFQLSTKHYSKKF